MAVTRDDGSSLEIPAPKRRAVLAALLLNANREVGFEQMAAALWDEDPPPSAAQSLQAHVSRLRRELGYGVIATGAHGYRIRLEDGELDVNEFARLSEIGRGALRGGQFTSASALLGEALALWRGTALGDVPGDFARQWAGSLEESRVAALEDRVEADLRAGRHAELIPELRQLTAQMPLHETFWQQLMLALYRSGRQADALAAYRDLRSLLVDELGVDPSPELQDLERRILRQEPGLADDAHAFRLSGRLPAWNGPLIGRELECEQLVALGAENRLLSVIGPGGVGKTRLAIEVARRLAASMEDGVQFVDLSSVRDPSLVLSTIGLEIGGGERPWEVIQDRHALLLVDNFEQVLDAAPGISELLDQCGRLHLVVTSRAPLRIRGETVVELAPLPLTDATELFAIRARQALLRWQADPRALEEIVTRLDGLPLAIELTAARVGTLAPRALRDALDRPLEVMSRGPRDAPQRHQTLREAIGWSYNLLDERARAGLRGISVFAGGFTLEAAGIVADLDIDSLGDLIDHSLIRRDGDRYDLLETIREFAFDEAQAHGEADARRDRHLAHYVELVQRLRSQSVEAEAQKSWLVAMSEDRDNLRVAFDWAMACGNREAVKGLARWASIFWLIIGSMSEGERWAQARADYQPPSDFHARAGSLAMLGEFPRWSGRHERAIEVRAEGIALARRTDDKGLLAELLDDAAWSVGALGRSDEANAMLDEALALRQQDPDDHTGLVHTLSSMAWQRLRDGRPDEALRLVGQVREQSARAKLWPTDANETDDLEAAALLAGGRVPEAEAMYRQVLRDSSRFDFRIAMLDSLFGLATIAATEDPDRAAQLVGMASRVRAESGIEVFDPAAYEGLQTDLRARLGGDGYEAARSHGLAVPLTAIPATVLEDPRP